MNAEQYLEEVRKLLASHFGVQLASNGKSAALEAHSQGTTPGQFVLSVARNDGLRPL